MSNINTAKSPWALLYFFVVSFFSLKREREEPPYCRWNFIIDMVRTFNFVWNNSILAKNKKEERTIIRHLYLNLFSDVIF